MRRSSFRVRRAAVLIALIGALVLVSVDAMAGGCRLQEIGEAPIRLVGGEMLVDAEVDGQPVTLRVDTGSAFSMLARATANRLGLRLLSAPPADVVALDGLEQIRRVKAVSLRIGSLEGDNQTILVADDDMMADSRAGGVLGEDLLARHDLEIDLAHGLIRFFDSRFCSDAEMPYWATSRYSQARLGPQTDYDEGAYATVELNHTRIVAIFGTGTPTSLVKWSVASSLAARAAPATGASSPAWIAIFDTFTVGDETVHNARMTIADESQYDRVTALGSQAGPSAKGGSGMIIGIDFFASHRVLISRSRQKIYFTYDGPSGIPGDAASVPAVAPAK